MMQDDRLQGSWMRRLVIILAIGALTSSAARPVDAQAPQGAPPSQEMRFADQIKAFLDQDRAAAPPKGAILFIGSSIFRQWTNVKEHMAPLPVFNRAFGGSRTWEVLHYMDQIVLPYRPKVIVYYTGSNDVNAGEPAPAIAGRIKAFVARAHSALPDTRIYFVAINRSPDKRAQWSVVDAVNADLKALSAATPHLKYIDLNPVLFDAQGEPRTELYRPDGLHFHPPAYELFAAIIKPVLTEAWQQLNSRTSGSVAPAGFEASGTLAAQ
jgi:lysophospholipase L1-like esterase